MSNPAPIPRTGGRSARVRASVLDATLIELAAHGYHGLSAAQVADRAGVHRTTIHRRWPDLDDLIVDALAAHLEETVEMPDLGSLRTDLTALLTSVSELLSGPVGGSVVRVVLAERGGSAAVSDVARQVLARRISLAAPIFQRAAERGELRDEVEPAALLATLIGPLYVRMLATTEPADATFIEQVVDLVLHGATRR